MKNVMTDKQTFYQLYAQVCESLPVDFAEQVLAKHPTLKITRLQNVRYGRTPDMAYLEKIVEVCLPDFQLNKAA